MQTDELIKIIKTYEDGDWWLDFVNDEFYISSYNEGIKEYLNSIKLEIKCEDHYGGEGQGDEYWHVFSVTKDGVKTFFKIDGWYASYDGAYFDDYFGFYKVSKVPVESYEWRKDNA